MEYIEEFDKLKTKVLKYILYKKRTESEVRQKFADQTSEMFESVILDLKEQKYIDDEQYIEKAVNEYINLKNISIKEIQYKLLSKGLNKDIINNYIYENKEKLLDYEVKSIQNILAKKSKITEKEEIIKYLLKKGYSKETINLSQT